MNLQFYKLKVEKVNYETCEAKSYTFKTSENLNQLFKFIHGQYLTLKFKLQGSVVYRCYSMSSSPLDNRLTITVKRVVNGLVSNHILDTIKEGDVIESTAPSGILYTELAEQQSKSYYLFGTGSGITRLYSILKTILVKEPKSKIFLFFGNRDKEFIIFRQELYQLALKHPNRFKIEHILSRSSISYLSEANNFGWNGKTGYMDEKNIASFLNENPNIYDNAEYLACGIIDMMKNFERVLLRRGINKKNIHTECIFPIKLNLHTHN